ncbi:MAG: flagellar motor protein MotB [Candidatus Hydrogenedentes bacterium]|nr:flagellar motor protein MotB [Candidatus Hydrogenedentota bacterium]
MGKGGKCPECEGGLPGWLATFADMMSLLLTFFILLLSFSSVSEDKFNAAAASMQVGFSPFPAFNSFIGIVPRQSKSESETDASKAARNLRRRLQVKGLEAQAKIEFDAVGGIKISLPSEVLFEQGSATLKTDSFVILQDLGEVLGELPDVFIEARGHTDGLPLANSLNFRNNYDLSFERAWAVVERLNQFGNIPLEQFEVVALGPNQPLATNTTPEGRQANRRVELYVRGLVSRPKIDNLLDGVDEKRPKNEDPFPVSPGELDDLR